MASRSAKGLFLRTFLPVLIAVVLVIGVLSVIKRRTMNSRSEQAGAVAVKEGDTVPDLELTRLSGETVNLSALEGKVFLVNFWATWCEACMVEMPSIVKLWKEFHAEGLEVLAVDVDENPQTVVPPVAKQIGMEFPIFADKDSRMGNLFDVHAIPMTLVLDRKRKVLLQESGENDWSSRDVREQIKRWLANQ